MKPTTRALSLALALAALTGAARAQQADDPALARAREVERDVVALVERVSPSYVVIGGGSGVIVSADGEILTNHHVAGSRAVGQVWTVQRPGGRFEQAKVIGLDARGDIALLKLMGPGPFPFVEMGDSDLVQAGDTVVALGNPFGFSKDATPHVSLGVVSAVHRFQGGYSDAIQVDTSINPGNSGGPLLDLHGRLIGINGRIAVRFGTRANTGVGYAIPTNQIKDFLPHFRAKGDVDHGTLAGLSLREAPADGGGALVERVAPGSQGARVGIAAGDVIIEADGRPVSGANRFLGILGTIPGGDPLPVTLRRGRETVKVELITETRAEAAESGGTRGTGGFLGVRMSNHEGGGVELEEIVAGSPAEKAGLQSGDIVRALTVGGARLEVTELNGFVAALGKLSPGAELTLTVQRGEATQDIQVTLGRR